MTMRETENHTLRQRVRELETALQSLQETHARVIEENEQRKGRIRVLERLLHHDTDGRIHRRVDVLLRVDGVNSRGEAAMGVARNVSAGGTFIDMALCLMPGELLTITFVEICQKAVSLL